MSKALFITQASLMLSLPMVGVEAKAPYLPRPHPHLYGNPKAYHQECQMAEAKHQVATEKKELKEGGDIPQLL
ncbi:MAG: hypothetical protein AB7F31_06165 [Parachlamydiales bacterium]